MVGSRRRVGFERLETRHMLSHVFADGEASVVRVEIPDLDVPTIAAEFSVLINISDARGLRGAEIHLAYDTALLDADPSSVQAGSIWAGDDVEVVVDVDDASGTIVAWVFAAEELEATAGSLLQVVFRTTAAVAPGQTTLLDLTHVRLNEDQITVDPAPQSGLDDTDGLVRFFLQPSIAISDVTLPEGDTGTTPFEFLVQLSAPSPLEVRVDYATLDGTATVADNDYQPASGTLVFAPGEITKTIVVLVQGDTKVEPDETFFVQLSNLVNVTADRTTATGTILNDDQPPVTDAGILGGFVFADANADGVPGAGKGIPGVKIQLVDAAGSVAAETWTDLQGWYEFRDVAPGQYRVAQRQPASMIDGGNNEISVQLAANSSRRDLHFREIGLLPQFVYTRLVAASTQPATSATWSRVVAQIERDAQVQDGNEQDPAPPQVTSQIIRIGSQVIARGSSGDDVFRFEAGATSHTVTLNGETQSFPAAEVTQVVFDGGLGNDTAELNGIGSQDEVDLAPKSATLRGEGYVVSMSAVEDISVRSTGPGAVARIADSPVDDQLRAERDSVRLNNFAYTQRVAGFRRVIATSQAGGQDLIQQASELDYVLEQVGSWLPAPF
jgi:hypothetical protein